VSRRAFSVCILAFNHGKFIEETIESTLRQTLPGLQSRDVAAFPALGRVGTAVPRALGRLPARWPSRGVGKVS